MILHEIGGDTNETTVTCISLSAFETMIAREDLLEYVQY
jgi:hypothetical protein